MFDSGIPASSLISTLKAEVDVAIPISNRSYVDSLNSLEQLLYTEVIKEQREADLSTTFDLSHLRVLFLNEIQTDNSEKPVISDDVYAVYLRSSELSHAGDIQLKKTTLATSPFVKRSWFIEYHGESRINVMVKNLDETNYRVVYFVRPALKAVNASDVVGNGNVMLPVEFIDLAKAKLRADAYKIANEDALAAKWLNDYNVLLETFKQWIEQKRPHFGI